LEDQLIPALRYCVDKYSEWWSFKINSPLEKYFNGRLDFYFRPEELITVLKEMAQTSDCFEPGNSQVILPDDELKKCFTGQVIFVPDLYTLCLPHVNMVENPQQLNALRNKSIAHDFWLDTSDTMLYKDPTAKFWVNPIINHIMCFNKEIVYSWKELCYLVTHFISTPNKHFTAQGDDMFLVNSDSVFANEFRFGYFHKSQIPTILKQASKYLGKRTTILTLCPELMLDDTDMETVAFIEHSLFGNNRLMPHVVNCVYV
jgi:hypothetical protein